MAYTKQTWADGSSGNTPVNAARLNYIENGIAAATVIGDFPYALARQTAAQTALAAGWQLMTYNTTEFDSHVGFSGGTYTVPAGQGGFYRVSAQVSVAANSANPGAVASRLMKNGSVVAGGVGTMYATAGMTAQTSFYGAVLNRTIQVAAGDTLSIHGFASWGSWATSIDVDHACVMGVERIR